MSFQGDVGGIGLAELMQSLARGRREGVLVLTARGGLRSILGVRDGALLLLPQPDEDPTIWRERVGRAWGVDSDARIAALRASEIARADRIETVYRLLDGEGVHFRFETDRAAQAGEEAAGASPSRQPEVHCEAVSVEFLLLEYARLNDETERLGPEGLRSQWLVPRPSGTVPAEADAFLGQCDGRSSVAEIADRLGWPIRQCRLAATNHLVSGALREAPARELLVLAQRELADGHLGRAAARLEAWTGAAAPGPMTAGDAALIEAEWRAGRLAPLLAGLAPRTARILLRRLERGLSTPSACLPHWRELARSHPCDERIRLHRMIAEHREGSEREAPDAREVLDAARAFLAAERPRRARALLGVAAARPPATSAAQLDLGLALVAAGAGEEAAEWILGPAREWIERGAPERATAALRALIAAWPQGREAHRLLSRARGASVRRRLIRKHSLVGLAILAAVSVGAWVRVDSTTRTQRALAEVQSLLERPTEALALLEERFADDDSAEVARLRRAIADRHTALAEERRDEWLEDFRAARHECLFGSPLAGLDRLLDLPPPPRVATADLVWPKTAEVLGSLAERVAVSLDELGPPRLDDPRQTTAERRIAALLTRCGDRLREQGADEDAAPFERRLAELEDALAARGTERERALAERERLDLLTRQDLWLAAARSHAEAGDDERALEAYARLTASDPQRRLSELLAGEIATVRERFETVEEARGLAVAGDHEGAREVLATLGEGARDEPLPWRLSTFPPGAVARLPDGRRRATPLVWESALGERVRVTLELAGCEPLTLECEGPADRTIRLSRIPERAWSATGVCEAPPVAVGSAHVVCDRSGTLRRLDARPELGWTLRLDTLAGLARAPVLLSRRAGHLLCVGEDGRVWIVEATTGAVEGPGELGSPCIAGPIPTAGGAALRLRDGRVLFFEEGLEPQPRDPDAFGDALDQARFGHDAGLAVLRRRADAERRLRSPWNGWTVRVEEEAFLAQRPGSDEGFAVRREGEWSLLAWEAPSARLPGGRLWVGDGAGLRAFTP
ncbi:MAG: DUF4388 domain-containing protein [Planctomycetota bacterium]|jgi:tetratricopeptide (TPR) repeat protein|nr:DUF4388 domain-containing protein [Planctomycetota bacterium]MDP6763714.1 DUF4388 domain-containing protein [Planctomycetota bacterium]MDP6990149.1 DUF4388 domain-containing protein [Planctomycetota bacterium]